MHNIGITAVLNGWIVTCGCQTLVFDECGSMLRKIKEYMENPEVVEKQYLDSSINAHLFKDPVPIRPRAFGTFNGDSPANEERQQK